MILEHAIELTTPFASTDETRPRLTTPFGVRVGGQEWIGATDGHRAALVHCPGGASYQPRNDHPPLDLVVPADAPCVGEFQAEAIDPLRELPKSWGAYVWRDGTSIRLHASRTKGSKKKQRTIRVFDGAIIQCALPGLPERVGICVEYLIAAADFCGTTTIHVRHGKELSPIAFAPTSEPLFDNARFAIVMPVRT